MSCQGRCCVWTGRKSKKRGKRKIMQRWFKGEEGENEEEERVSIGKYTYSSFMHKVRRLQGLFMQKNTALNHNSKNKQGKGCTHIHWRKKNRKQ